MCFGLQPAFAVRIIGSGEKTKHRKKQCATLRQYITILLQKLFYHYFKKFSKYNSLAFQICHFGQGQAILVNMEFVYSLAFTDFKFKNLKMYFSISNLKSGFFLLEKCYSLLSLHL